MGFGKFKFVVWCDGEKNRCDGYEAAHIILSKMETKYSFSYIFYGDEMCPNSDPPNRKHIDGYYEYPTARKLNTEIKKFTKAFGPGFGDIQIANGSAGENCDYSEKEGRYTYASGVAAAQGVRKDVVGAISDITDGKDSCDNICLTNPELFHTYGRTLSRAEDILTRRKFRTEMTVGIWYWGATGTGKSHVAFEGFDPSTHYVYKLNEQWQDGYTGQEIVIINDLRDEIQFNHLLLLVDKWPHTLPRRGREPAPFLATKVIVTSSLPPHLLYASAKRITEDSLDQLSRRFEVVELTTVRVPVLPLTTP